jgi:O-acetyl-ADP-ribose deacetylase
MAARDVRIEITRGDITAQPDIDAVVNAANAELLPGGGVAGAIHAAAGPELRRACRPLAPIEPGQAVITAAFGLPNRYVIHVLGPRFGIDEPAADLLAACFERAVALADEHELTSIAFPAVSTGAFGYPVAEAAPVALAAAQRAAERARTVRLVRFVLHGEHELRAFARARSERG